AGWHSTGPRGTLAPKSVKFLSDKPLTVRHTVAQVAPKTCQTRVFDHQSVLLFLLQLAPRGPCGFSDSGVGAFEGGLFGLEKQRGGIVREFLVAAGKTELKQDPGLVLISFLDRLAEESHGVAGVFGNAVDIAKHVQLVDRKPVAADQASAVAACTN